MIWRMPRPYFPPNTSDTHLTAIIEELATAFAAHFPETLEGPRTIGREAEYPVVTATGEAADVRRLWEPMLAVNNLQPKYDTPKGSQLLVGLEGTDAQYVLEVGLGTVEVTTGPCADLFALQAAHEAAMQRLVEAAAPLGYRVLGYGIQPVSPPALALMAPKQRYQAIYQAMGADWLWFTITASDQVQIDICRPELVRMINFGNLIAPIVIALCANSPVYGGALSPFCSAREGLMGQIYAAEARHGMIPRPFEDLTDFIATMARETCLVLRREDARYVPYGRPFVDYLAEHGADFPAFLIHEHYIWNSARARVAHATLEIRPACQQPWGEHMAAAALALGLVEALDAIEAYLKDRFGDRVWSVLRAYHREAVRHGLEAPPPAPEFLRTVLTLAAEGLERRGKGEKVFLDPLFERLARGANPAQEVQRVFRQEGVQGLLRRLEIGDW